MTATPKRMSAKLTWTIAIVGLLAGNIVAMIVLMMAAGSASPAIVPDYYERAAHFDTAIDDARRSASLGWTTHQVVSPTGIEVRVADRDGAPLGDATVRVTGYARAQATRQIDVTLVATGPGTYRAGLASTAGVHDLTIVVERGADRFVASTTVEAQ